MKGVTSKKHVFALRSLTWQQCREERYVATPSHALELVYCRTYTISVHVNLELSSVPDGAPTTQ